MYRVYDDRTGETLFESESKIESYVYMTNNYDENHKDFAHVWLGEVENK